MNCPYCKIEMDAVGMTLGNGWKCSKCGHEYPECASWKMTEEGYKALMGFECKCEGCTKGSVDQKMINQANQNWECLFSRYGIHHNQQPKFRSILSYFGFDPESSRDLLDVLNTSFLIHGNPQSFFDKLFVSFNRVTRNALERSEDVRRHI